MFALRTFYDVNDCIISTTWFGRPFSYSETKKALQSVAKKYLMQKRT